MKRIGIMSDTHSVLHDAVFRNFEECDEIWHAGDIGEIGTFDQLTAFKPLRIVFGNIDGHELRRVCKEDLHFELEGHKIYMTHIGGYPGRYNTRAGAIIRETRPDIFVCGHSHILRIMPDPKNNLLHFNPGACGNHGFHKVKTLVRLSLEPGKIFDVEVIEF